MEQRVREQGLHLAKLADGDDRAFQQLVDQYYGLAYSLAYKTLDDAQDAEEVAQDAFVKIHGALAQFKGEASLKTWILRIVWRLSLNKRRDRARSSWRRLGLHRGASSATEEGAVWSGSNPEGLVLAAETRRLVRRLVAELPEALRAVMILSSFEELSYEEIGRILRLPPGTVGSRIYSARRRLLKKFKQLELL